MRIAACISSQVRYKHVGWIRRDSHNLLELEFKETDQEARANIKWLLLLEDNTVYIDLKMSGGWELMK